MYITFTGNELSKFQAVALAAVRAVDDGRTITRSFIKMIENLDSFEAVEEAVIKFQLKLEKEGYEKYPVKFITSRENGKNLLIIKIESEYVTDVLNTYQGYIPAFAGIAHSLVGLLISIKGLLMTYVETFKSFSKDLDKVSKKWLAKSKD